MKTSLKILLLLLAATVSFSFAGAETPIKQVFTSNIKATYDFPCGKTEVVFAYLRDDMQLSPLYSSATKLSPKDAVISAVWFSTWPEDNKTRMVITESTTGGLTCVSATYNNVKQVDPGTKM